MTPERWRAVDAILQQALASEPARRRAFVADACAGDADLLREVSSLLAADDLADEFLERPAAEALGVLAAPPRQAERLAMALVGRYEIEGEIAQGGMSTVYLARDVRHDRRVAIKVLRQELAAAVGADRFLAEIRFTASLQHPHILPLFDSGNADELLWYAMPFVEGETLRSRLSREGRLPVDEAVRLVREMAEALDHAHRHGVVHRDVKPENVLLQGEHALVADFGIALALEHAGGERLTLTGIALGTPQYRAPEQASGERAIDARADVYALGAVLHEMLVGQSPFSASSRAAVLWRVRNEPATAVATHRIDVAPFLDAAVQRALAKRPEDRFSSAAAFAAALSMAADATPVDVNASGSDSLAEPASAAHAGDPARRGRVVSARWALYAAGATLVAGLVGGWMLAQLPLFARQTSAAPTTQLPSQTLGADRWPAAAGEISLAVVDRSGRALRTIPANRPWTPRFSPDGKRVAYGAFGSGRSTSDLWVTDLGTGTTKRLTDDDRDSNDPQWSPNGSMIGYSVDVPGGKDVFVQGAGGGQARVLASRDGMQFPSDWLRDGSALLVTEGTANNGYDILVQPADGSPPRPYATTPANETAARISPDGRWVAFTSDESGKPEVYIDSYPKPTRRTVLSLGGGVHPVWRGDGKELYYWQDGALVAAQLGSAWGDGAPSVTSRSTLFRAPYLSAINAMYDVSPDGKQIIMVGQH
jgi:serine/threonine-protein kinase